MQRNIEVNLQLLHYLPTVLLSRMPSTTYKNGELQFFTVKLGRFNHLYTFVEEIIIIQPTNLKMGDQIE